MSAASTFVSRRAPRIAVPLAWVVLACAALGLLASVVAVTHGGLPAMVDDPHLAPFRWERIAPELA